MKVIIYSYICH